MEQEPDRKKSGREPTPTVEGISAVTLATHDMARTIQFYRSLGFVLHYDGETAPFTSLAAGASYLNLIAQPAERRWSWWGRVIFSVGDVDEPGDVLRHPRRTDPRLPSAGQASIVGD
jgi:catechol 2,3-dioxygenase-like lactoylglutathione lyase family enzyme